MKTVIYYFTGTGNSLAVATQIANELGDCGLVPIAPLAGTAGDIVPPAGRVGIVCPVYDMGLPVIVAEFAARLSLAGTRYVFGIVTMGGAGVSALDQLGHILQKKNGRSLDAGFAVKMPGNFPPVHRPPEGAERDKILAAAGWQIREIAKKIETCEPVRPGLSLFSSLLYLLTYRLFARSVRTSDKNFSVSDACTSCGTCAKVCPVHNIRMEQGRPAWQHRCECCCACLHFCPVQAIDLNSLHGTKGRGRYRHPALKLDDMTTQAGRYMPSGPGKKT
jgi:ferredoxin